MNRRDFMKNVGASGMAIVAPVTLSSKASAATELTPVGQYFVFLHLGGGWEPTTFCNPMGNKLRSEVGADLGISSASIRNGGSPVNRYPASAIRLAQDIYAGTQSITADLKYAPYLGQFNNDVDIVDPDDAMNTITVNDDGLCNEGLTTLHIQQVLSGDIAGNTLTAAVAAGFDWKTTKTEAQIQVNAAAILEGTVTTIELNGIEGDLVDRQLALAGTAMNANLFVYDAFVCLHAEQLRVLNGVDNRTNSHDTGTRYADTGSLATGYPDFSALYAAVHGADRPLAWMTDGRGNDEPAGLVARSAAADAQFFNILGNPTDDMTTEFEGPLAKAQAARAQIQSQSENLPLRRQFQDQLYMVRNQGGEFATVAADITNPTSTEAIAVRDAAAGNNTRNHMRIGAAGFATGMASSMQVGFGGFDTHGNHDNSHYPRIRGVLTDLHFLLRALDAYSVREQTTVVVGSDFGRTPWYNDGDGKDHWAVTSYLLMGNGVNGGTSVNATNGLIEATNVNESSMAPQTVGGIRMTASHVHKELRKLANIDGHEFAAQFPIDAEDLPIFS